MSFITAALIGGGAAILGGAISGRAASQAADTQARAAEQGTAAQERMFQKQIELQEPWRQAGIGALNKLIPLSDYQKFGMAQFQQDPGYAFRLAEGQKALERSAAARGGLLSGGTGKALTRYGQEAGSQEYMNAFNRYQAERAAQLQPLQSLAGVGQTSSNTLTGAAGQMGQNIAEGIGSAAAARASGYVGGANALSNALGQGMNYYQQGQLMNKLFPTQTSSFVGPTYGAQPLGPSFSPYLVE